MRLVRECLRVHVGARCPGWIDDLLWAQLQALPYGHYRRITATFSLSGEIDYGIFRQDEIRWRRFDPRPYVRPCHMPTHSGLPGAELEAADTVVRVEVGIEVKGLIGRWVLRCLQGDRELRCSSDLATMWTVMEMLTEIRDRFDGRLAGPSGSMEVPSTWQEWRSFMRLWLFGPPAPEQAPITKWLRRRPALDLHERCRECGKTSAPDMQHSVRKLGGAFCSARCATAHAVLSCSQCKEPLSVEQGLCKARACRLGRGLPEHENAR